MFLNGLSGLTSGYILRYDNRTYKPYCNTVQAIILQGFPLNIVRAKDDVMM